MFGSTSGQELSSPVGSFSIWVPRPEGSAESTPPQEASKELPDDLASGFKLWVPGHILEQEDHMLKAAFLVPTMMNKIFLEVRRFDKKIHKTAIFLRLKVFILFRVKSTPTSSLTPV